jgi:hypothetical protein
MTPQFGAVYFEFLRPENGIRGYVTLRGIVKSISKVRLAFL